ncbi:NADH-quinone oxidoreductase subunit L [candidate division BRC1 bacterium HGW-BRC1-1]|nr:MAG: NADH-quinone oxidoreductase subunit L [candidate division BRC1 bacterium HGW-BRC1-1]
MIDWKIAILVPILPALGFFIMLFFGGRMPRKGDWFATGIMGATLALSLSIFVHLFKQNSAYATILESTPWFNAAPGRPFLAGILVDNLSALMIVMISTISFLVHLFSIGYMHGDVRYHRFFTVLQLFTAAMLALVLADNFLTLYVAWEIMGLCSYLLIGHYFDKQSAANASLKAFMTTRIGDVLMFVGILIIFTQTGSFRFENVFSAVAAGTFTGNWQMWAGLLLFGGAMGKSAQFPLHIWLPDAMEGPTPVSALIHAATMVAAGVFLMARSYPMLTPEVFLVMAYVGGFTAIFAATIGIVMDDIKKVLAYSTISQLGYMMLGLGVGGFIFSGYTSGVYHLITHAFFKACLFLGSGSVIHAVHSQSMSQMGGLRRKLPITFATFIIATLALTGLPPFSGFFTKDSIIAGSIQLSGQNSAHILLPIFSVAAAALTSFYMFRLIILTFFGTPRDEAKYAHAHESPWTMALPLMILTALSIWPMGGHHDWFWFRNPVPLRSEVVSRYTPEGSILAVAHDKEQKAVFVETPQESHEHPEAASPRGLITAMKVVPIHEPEEEHAHHLAVIFSLCAFFLGLGGAYLTYSARKISAEAMARRFRPVYVLLLNKYYVDEFFQIAVIRPLMRLCGLAAWLDRWVVDGAVNATGRVTKVLSYIAGQFDRIIVDGAVNGVANSVAGVGRNLSRLQTGRVGNYLVFILAGVVFLGGFMFWMAVK